MNALQFLLHPYDMETFLQRHWVTEAIVISGQGQRRFSHLFSWNILNDLLNFHPMQYPDLRLAMDEKVLEEADNDRLAEWCQQGATLILNQIHRHVPAIAGFAAELRQILGFRTQVNAYSSYPHHQGFSCHYDTHEVFILQIEGSKQWRVFQETFASPLPEQKSAGLTPPPDPPYLKCTLYPGDVLYIPRGHWHDAITDESPSLHLTLGIHVKTGIDLLEWLVDDLRQQVEWRKSLPARCEVGSMQPHWSTLAQTLADRLADPTLGDRYQSYLDSLAQPVKKYDFPRQAGFDQFPHGVDTSFQCVQFQPSQVIELPEQAGFRILAAGKEVLLRGVTATLVQHLFQPQPFTGRDVLHWLPDYDWEMDVMPLLSRLITEGILFVEAGIRDG
ncbi:MAG: cupin domain-containing protein [Elainella sp. Prado103]|jgi:ribosomal protein L16 Arg81 hydroxylase|nr:cupin domain-containing protein [Elainella sp. Prado103]